MASASSDTDSSQSESQREGSDSHTSGDHMDFLRCFLCDRAYTQPKLLPCLHSFCKLCLQTHLCATTGPSTQGLGPGREGSTGEKVVEDDQSVQVPEPDLEEGEDGESPLSTPSISSSDTDCGSGQSDIDSLPDNFKCPMCKTNVSMPRTGLDGFKDNFLIIEMVRRWEEKLFGDKRGTDSSKESLKKGNEKGVGNCTCLPAWKNLTNGKVSGGLISEKDTRDNCGNYNSASSHNYLNGSKSASMAKHMDKNADTQYYCVNCDVMVCGVCKASSHCDHRTKTISEATSEKRDYLQSLLGDLSYKSNVCDTALLQVENSHQHLLTSTEHIVKEIEERAAKLIAVIQARRNQLIDELSLILKQHEQKLAASKANLNEEKEKFMTAAKFACDLLEYGTSSDVMYLNSDVSGRLHELLKDQNNNAVDVANVRLEIPAFGHDEAHMVKAFGSLVQGEIKCGSAQLLQSFDLDLKWPTGMATTKNKEFVVTGKMGAFEEKGKVMFFGRSGKLKTMYDLDENCIPYDTAVTGDGTVLVADNMGRVHTFDSSGHKIGTMTDLFKGVGRLAPVQNAWGNFVVTSSEEKKVYVYKENGELDLVIPNAPASIDDDNGDDVIRLDHPHYVATNQNNDVVISDFEQNAVYTFDSGGSFRFKYCGSGIEGGDLKCPSAVCCDNFNNILVADFMNDRVHLISQSGQFLGYLLTKDDSVTCPNFLSIDGDGHLFVGQYGGQIQVFQYMSYVKFA